MSATTLSFNAQFRSVSSHALFACPFRASLLASLSGSLACCLSFSRAFSPSSGTLGFVSEHDNVSQHLFLCHDSASPLMCKSRSRHRIVPGLAFERPGGILMQVRCMLTIPCANTARISSICPRPFESVRVRACNPFFPAMAMSPRRNLASLHFLLRRVPLQDSAISRL